MYLQNTQGLVGGVWRIVDMLIPIAFSLAVVVFFYGIVKYIWSEGQGKAEGKSIMTWGVIAIFVMASVWGIVYYIRGELNIFGSDREMQIPRAVY